jgi:hypothetical protein
LAEEVTSAKTIGVILSFCILVSTANSDGSTKWSTFLSEKYPHNRVVMAATTPPGVERIKVCFDV